MFSYFKENLERRQTVKNIGNILLFRRLHLLYEKRFDLEYLTVELKLSNLQVDVSFSWFWTLVSKALVELELKFLQSLQVYGPIINK